MDLSSQWLAEQPQHLSRTDNIVIDSLVRGWRGEEWRLEIKDEAPGK